MENVELCVFAAPFGVTPLELDETYPLSQYESSPLPDQETKQYVVQEVVRYLSEHRRSDQSAVVYAAGELGEAVAETIEKQILKNLTVIKSDGRTWSRDAMDSLSERVKDAVSSGKTPNS